MALNLQELYKLPWSANNNPHGWIEVTTYCQLACPGCYRGLALPNPKRVHEDIKNLKKQIDTLIKIRKIKILSIAGGEPLLYPKLEEIIKYAKKRGLQVRILTNGQSLTKNRLLALKAAGTTEIVIHLAQYQNRPGNPKVQDINLLREKYCQMFREVKNVELDFIMTTYDHNFNQLPDIIRYYQKNSDIISHVYFTLYRDVFFDKPNDRHDTKIDLGKIANLISSNYKSKPCAYLGKTINPQGISWLFYVVIFHNGKVIGHLNHKIFEKLHDQFYINGEYTFPVNGNRINLVKTVPLFLNRSSRKIFFNYLKNIAKNPKDIFSPIRIQVINILNTPEYTQNGWDICDGCPDAMLFKNRLVPSCLLERVKQGEYITV